MLADLHCDTAYECFVHDKKLTDESLHINCSLIEKTDDYFQFFAHYIPEDRPDKWAFLKELLAFSKTILSENGFEILAPKHKLPYGKRKAAISVENCDVFEGGDLNKLEDLKQADVAVISLVYNHTNALGCGARSENDTGLTELGRNVAQAAGACGIILDVSHASYKTTEDILSISELPVLATHSNAYAITPHPRNLQDYHIRRIAESGGLIGLNLYPPFLSDRCAGISDIAKHLRHILDVGGEDCLALGCDLDGVDRLPKGIRNLVSVSELFGTLQQYGFSKSVLEKVFYKNVNEFVRSNFGG